MKLCIKLHKIWLILLIESITKHLWPLLIKAFIGKAMSDIGSCNARPQTYFVNRYLKCNAGCMSMQIFVRKVLYWLDWNWRCIRKYKLAKFEGTFIPFYQSSQLLTWQHTFSNPENSSMLCRLFQGSKWCGTLLGLSIENSLWLYIPFKALDISCWGYLVGC